MVPDPYKALGLSHDATASQIKVAYRKLALQYHPDRLVSNGATEQRQKEASDKFAAISSAYALLTDERRKREYDHIYKFGGYDDEPDNSPRPTPSRPPPAPRRNSDDPIYYRHRTRGGSGGGSRGGPFSVPPPPPPPPPSGRRGGIGFVAPDLTDPLGCFVPRPPRRNRSFAGIHVPSRQDFSPARPSGSAGFSFTFSSAQSTVTAEGARKFVSKNTQFANGKKFTKVETTILHQDGRREVVVEGNDYVKRRVSYAPTKAGMTTGNRDPDGAAKPAAEETTEPSWYANMWKKFTVCNSPCGPFLVQ